MNAPPPLPSETIEVSGQTRVAELVEAIERGERERDRCWSVMDKCSLGSWAYRRMSQRAVEEINRVADARDELHAIIGCDPYRLASALGA